MNFTGSHFKLVCKECGIIIAQGRCMDKNKPVLHDICDKCKGKEPKQET